MQSNSQSLKLQLASAARQFSVNYPSSRMEADQFARQYLPVGKHEGFLKAVSASADQSEKYFLENY